MRVISARRRRRGSCCCDAGRKEDRVAIAAAQVRLRLRLGLRREDLGSSGGRSLLPSCVLLCLLLCCCQSLLLLETLLGLLLLVVLGVNTLVLLEVLRTLERLATGAARVGFEGCVDSDVRRDVVALCAGHVLKVGKALA